MLRPALAAQWTESFCNAGALGSIPGSERPPGEGMATHSSILAWKIHGQRGQLGCRQWSHSRVGHDLATNQQIGFKGGRQCVCGGSVYSPLRSSWLV